MNDQNRDGRIWFMKKERQILDYLGFAKVYNIWVLNKSDRA